MAIELKAGQIVLMNSGGHSSSVSLMRVYGTPTPRKVRGQSWDSWADDWEVTAYTRDRGFVVAVLADGVDPATVYAQLQDAATAAHEERKAATQRYKDRVQAIARGEGVTKDDEWDWLIQHINQLADQDERFCAGLDEVERCDQERQRVNSLLSRLRAATPVLGKSS